MHEYYVCFSFFEETTNQSLISDAFVKSEKKLEYARYRILYIKEQISNMLNIKFKTQKFIEDDIKILNILEIS